MAVVNKWLRWVFIGFNAFLEIVAILIVVAAIVGLAAFSTTENRVRDPAMQFFCMEFLIIAFGISSVAGLGIWGIKREKKWALVVYITTHTIALVILLVFMAKLALVTVMAKSYHRNHLQSDEFPAILQMIMGSVWGIFVGFIAFVVTETALAATILRQMSMHDTACV